MIPKSTHAIVCYPDGHINLEIIPLPACQDDEVCVKAECSAISPGTELRCWRREQPGGPQGPYIPGYSMVGRIIASSTLHLPIGTRVFCGGTLYTEPFAKQWGGHCHHAIVKASSCVVVPENISSEEASLAALGGIAMHGVRHVPPQYGEPTLTIGLGVIGQLVIRLLHLHHANCLGLDLSSIRVEQLTRQGIMADVPRESIASTVFQYFSNGVTLLFDATGSPQVIPQAIQAIQPLPWDESPQTPRRYVIQGSYPGTFSIPYQEAFSKQITFYLPRARQLIDAQLFLVHLSGGQLHVTDLIHTIFPPQEFAKAYQLLLHPQDMTGTCVIDWRKL